jgi:hypothetical protein
LGEALHTLATSSAFASELPSASNSPSNSV